MLLTGATGFLGAFLLDALRAQKDTEVVCLVRAADAAEAAARIRESLRRYRLDDILTSVVAVAGDLARPDLGLGPGGFAELAPGLDAVFHNGARVNHLEPYARLRAANVSGTREILRLAATAGGKPVHFVSSCDMAIGTGANPPVLPEERTVDAHSVAPNGYVASKWVAESLVRAGHAAGIPAAVYRPSRISGDTRTGAGSTTDSFWTLIRAMLVLEAAPTDVGTVDLVPVDQVAAAIVHLSKDPDSPGRTFHLTSPCPTPVTEILQRLRRRGYRLAEIPAPQWRSRLAEAGEQAADSGDHGLWTALAHSGVIGHAAPAPVFGQDNARRGLAGSGAGITPVGADLIDRYIDRFIEDGHFPAPAAAAR